jgi:hypothetical protein
MVKANKEEKILIEIGKLVGKKAQEENFALGLPITIEENGYVVEVKKDGTKKRIKKITKINFEDAI